MRRLLAGILMFPNHISGFDVALKIVDARPEDTWMGDVWRPLRNYGYVVEAGGVWTVSDKGLEFLKGGDNDPE
jgi:hypothetical protein